jgi:hypothetical protein
MAKKKQQGTEYLITNIKYDTDGMSAKKLGLPKTMKIVVPDEEHTCYEDIENFISDEISNRTGYCHEGFATTPEIPE